MRWPARVGWRLRLLLRTLRLIGTFGPLMAVYPLMALNERSLRVWWTIMLILGVVCVSRLKWV
jgi:hypothetical protein